MLNKQNKSFARRIGKTLSNLQKAMLENELPKYLFNAEKLADNNQYIMEIGIGMADHFVARAKNKPEFVHIGVDPYLNGIANCLKVMKIEEVENVLLWPDDVDLVLDKIKIRLAELYILFPDPWPKKNQKKRRIINQDRIEILVQMLEGNFYFASDIEDYFQQVEDLVTKVPELKIIYSGDKPYEGYVKTKYHQKAENEGRKVQYLIAEKNNG